MSSIAQTHGALFSGYAGTQFDAEKVELRGFGGTEGMTVANTRRDNGLPLGVWATRDAARRPRCCACNKKIRFNQSWLRNGLGIWHWACKYPRSAKTVHGMEFWF